VGDQDHYKISITWSGFEGISRVMQHKAVYKALGDVAGGKLHALSIETRSS
jgi:stress-induced morphogen